MTELTGPARDAISLRRVAPRAGTDPILRASVAQVRPKPAVLTARDFVVVGGAIAFVAFIGLLYLLQSAEITGVAYRVNDARARVERLRQENSVLEFEAMQLERLERVESRATFLGLSGAQKLHFLTLSSGDAAQEAVAASSGDATGAGDGG